MTDTDSEKLDRILKRLDQIAEALIHISDQIRNPPAMAPERTSPAPSPKPRKQP
jgi:hypothetical protein